MAASPHSMIGRSGTQARTRSDLAFVAQPYPRLILSKLDSRCVITPRPDYWMHIITTVPAPQGGETGTCDQRSRRSRRSRRSKCGTPMARGMPQSCDREGSSLGGQVVVGSSLVVALRPTSRGLQGVRRRVHDGSAGSGKAQPRNLVHTEASIRRTRHASLINSLTLLTWP